jgi:methionyl-tRNA formyltransferase
VRVVFMGTPRFAVPSLRALAAEHDVRAVFTRPDMPAGRGREPRPSPVKEVAEGLGLTVIQPVTLRDPAEVERLRSLAPDVICVVAYGMLLPPEVLGVPRLGCVNVHASLLPRHRGAAPIERAVLEGDAQIGVAVMLMEAGLDTGPVAAQASVPIDGASAGALRETLAVVGAQALIAVLSQMEAGTAVWTRQDDTRATPAAKITANDVALEPALSAIDLERRVRASGESAVSRALIEGRVVTIEEARRVDASPGAGLVELTREGVVLGTAEGGLLVTRLTPAGKRSMAASDFARGARLADGSTWGAAS